MTRFLGSLFVLVLCANSARPQPAVTIYNDGFAVVRDTLDLELSEGLSQATYTEATAYLEPQSVVLRDPSESWDFSILEQNYRADPVSSGYLLSLYEGKELEFEKGEGDDTRRVLARIVRSGYSTADQRGVRFGQVYTVGQQPNNQSGGREPIVEMDGALRFGLPGKPIFPSLGEDTILKPTLEWKIDSARCGVMPAVISYITYGMGWLADYNVVARHGSDLVELVGWITLDNHSGKTFEDARVKLMAGDVNKISEDERFSNEVGYMDTATLAGSRMSQPIEEKSFEDFHLYSLSNQTTLRDRETKQVEFTRAGGVTATSVYVYDGAFIPPNRYRGWDQQSIRQDEAYGTESNPKVWIMREIENTEENQLGLPLPKGKVRFYKQDRDGQLEFTGENLIDHTPREETIRLFTGNAFDIVGERTRTEYQVDHNDEWLRESFEIVVKNRKEEPVVVRVVEHLYRWVNWEMRDPSAEYNQVDSDTVEFTIEIPAESEKTVTYTAYYTW